MVNISEAENKTLEAITAITFNSTKPIQDTDLQDEIRLANMVIMITTAVSSVLGVAGNALILICLIKEHKLRTIANCLIAHLAAVNLICSALIISSQASMYHQYSDFACVVLAVFGIAFFMMSLHSQLVISFNRYMLVTKPITVYNRWFTMKTMAVLLASLWCLDLLLFSIGQGIVSEWEMNYYAVQSLCLLQTTGYFFILFSPMTWVSFVLALIFYVALIVYIRKKSTKICQRTKRDIKTSMTLLVVMLLYLVTFNIIPAVMAYFNKPAIFSYLTRHWLNGTVKVLQFVNFCVSPVIFGLNIKDFRCACRKLVCSSRKRTIQPTNTVNATAIDLLATVPNTGVFHINN